MKGKERERGKKIEGRRKTREKEVMKTEEKW